MYSVDEWHEFERTRTGERPGAPRWQRPTGRPRTRQSQLTMLAVVIAAGAVLRMLIAGSSALPLWYSYADSGASLLGAAFYFAVARAKWHSRPLMVSAIAASVLRLALSAIVFTSLTVSVLRTVVYGFALPGILTVIAIVMVIRVMKGLPRRG